MKAFQGQLAAQVMGGVGPQLQKGAGTASDKCVAVAKSWSGKWVRGGTACQGLHWATYKAHCRRNGSWRFNWNELLSEPVLQAAQIEWEKTFVSGLQTSSDELSKDLLARLGAFHDAVAARFQSEGVSKQRFAWLREPLDRSAATKVEAAVAAVKTKVQATQRDLSRSVAPTVQAKMSPGYVRGAAECGGGSHRRRVDVVETHLYNIKDTLFQSAVQVVVGSLGALQKDLGKVVDAGLVDKLLVDLRTTYGILWEELTPVMVAARAAMCNTVRDASLEAGAALGRLRRSQAERADGGDGAGGGGGGDGGGSDGGGGDDDDDELVDVTSAVTAKRAREMEVVEISDDDEDEQDDEGGGGGKGAKENAGGAIRNGVPAGRSGLAKLIRVKAEQNGTAGGGV